MRDPAAFRSLLDVVEIAFERDDRKRALFDRLGRSPGIGDKTAARNREIQPNMVFSSLYRVDPRRVSARCKLA